MVLVTVGLHIWVAGERIRLHRSPFHSRGRCVRGRLASSVKLRCSGLRMVVIAIGIKRHVGHREALFFRRLRL